jgi:hypothetical protein
MKNRKRYVREIEKKNIKGDKYKFEPGRSTRHINLEKI